MSPRRDRASVRRDRLTRTWHGAQRADSIANHRPTAYSSKRNDRATGGRIAARASPTAAQIGAQTGFVGLGVERLVRDAAGIHARLGRYWIGLTDAHARCRIRFTVIEQIWENARIVSARIVRTEHEWNAASAAGLRVEAPAPW